MKKMLYILGEDLAKSTGLQRPVCTGMMRLSIENLAGSKDPAALETYISKMGFHEWKLLIADQDLTKRLANLGVKDSAGVLAHAQTTLVENQTLFTMAVI